MAAVRPQCLLMRAHCKDVEMQQESVAFAGKGREGMKGRTPQHDGLIEAAPVEKCRSVASANRNS